MNVQNVSISIIDEDLAQPRYTFDEQSIKELASSISEVGLLNPIKIRKTDNGRYKIIFGNRRYKACKLLGISNIPCIISESDNELDIYLEQLAENIQRENFTPVEEAEAFHKMIENTDFKVSSKFLASKLGKAESYVRKKLDLLNFGLTVRQLVKTGADIEHNKLTEDQLLPLKDISIEFRDPLAKIIARDQVSVQDVKRISTVFRDNSIRNETKEGLLNQTGVQLIRIWSVYDEEKRSPKQSFQSPIGVTNEYSPGSELLETFTITPIEEKLQELLTKIPTHRPIASDVIYSFEKIKINDKADFLRGIEGMISNLEKHLIEWRKINDIARAPSIKKIK